jgi:hypothetical protein
MADLTDLFREDLATLGLAGSLLSGIKGEVSAEQASRGEEPYQHRAETSSFWFFCPTCHRRQRGPWSPGSPVELACTKCGREVVLDGADLWKRMMPDIVAYECGLFRLGIDGWIVGSRAAYHPVIERTYAHVFGMIMPPKFFLTSIPVFRGAGDPPEGYGKTRLLRALLEIEPEVLGQALRAPWGEDPFIRSDLLSEPQTGRAT